MTMDDETRRNETPNVTPPPPPTPKTPEAPPPPRARPAPEAPEPPPRRERRQVTFMGNNYDITAMGALATGILTLFTCVTCGQGLYCLPVLPLILGIIGLAAAGQSVDEERTRTWSWIGIGSSAAMLLLAAAAIVGYILFMMFIVFVSGARRY